MSHVEKVVIIATYYSEDAKMSLPLATTDIGSEHLRKMLGYEMLMLTLQTGQSLEQTALKVTSKLLGLTFAVTARAAQL